MVAYELSQDCAFTILLHAAKYPSCTINGLLLSKASAESGALVFSSAVPLFHSSSAYLTPCVETALIQVDAYARQHGLKIAGYYHAEYRFEATDIHPTGKRVADKIADKVPAACIVAVNSSKLAAFCGVQTGSDGAQQMPFDLYLRDSSGQRSSWKQVAPSSSGRPLTISGSSGAVGLDTLHKRFLNAFSSSRHLQLADFDEHMDDLEKDYTNQQLLSTSQLITR